MMADKDWKIGANDIMAHLLIADCYRLGMITEEDFQKATEKLDVQPIVRCKDCKHRPIVEGDYISEPGEIYSDYTCPYLCDDCWYNRMPEDSWFCNHGEKMGGGT